MWSKLLMYLTCNAVLLRAVAQGSGGGSAAYLHAVESAQTRQIHQDASSRASCVASSNANNGSQPPPPGDPHGQAACAPPAQPKAAHGSESADGNSKSGAPSVASPPASSGHPAGTSQTAVTADRGQEITTATATPTNTNMMALATIPTHLATTNPIDVYLNNANGTNPSEAGRIASLGPGGGNAEGTITIGGGHIPALILAGLFGVDSKGVSLGGSATLSFTHTNGSNLAFGFGAVGHLAA
ncbi:hypothetical protein GGI12_000070 [Dipsacomyces acuminosporus]|nr:hypothetical protein GGI12_000070 [Dipsacomyces acuminosporus]